MVCAFPQRLTIGSVRGIPFAQCLVLGRGLAKNQILQSRKKYNSVQLFSQDLVVNKHQLKNTQK